jgi:hypothetical protein
METLSQRMISNLSERPVEKSIVDAQIPKFCLNIWQPQKNIVYNIWVNYHDLTATSLESWLVREIIPKWP